MKRTVANCLACWIVGGICISLITGCGSASDRKAVEGVVTLDGHPLSEGNVAFRPISGTRGPTAGGRIENGRFSISAQQGIFVGKFRVEITASRKTGRKEKIMTGQMIDQIEQYLPEKYNRRSELTAEVTSDSPNRLDFQLSSK